MNLIGLDLGTAKIKLVEVEKDGGKIPKLVSFASFDAPKASLFSEAQADKDAYVASLSDCLSSSNLSTDRAVFALRDSQTFTKVISFPKMDSDGVKKALELGADQHIPIPIKEVAYGFEILGDSVLEAGKIDVFVVATKKSLVEDILKVLKKGGLDILGVETESMAQVRSLMSEEDLKVSFATLILNIGVSSSDLTVVYSGGIRFTRTISTGGLALTRAIAQDFGFDLNQAEEYKKAYGLDPTFLEGRVADVIRPIFDVTVEEINRAIAFFNSRVRGALVKRVIVSGGVALMPGVLAYLASQLNLEVELANCWQKINVPNTFAGSEISEAATSFSVACGLSLKEV